MKELLTADEALMTMTQKRHMNNWEYQKMHEDSINHLQLHRNSFIWQTFCFFGLVAPFFSFTVYFHSLVLFSFFFSTCLTPMFDVKTQIFNLQ